MMKTHEKISRLCLYLSVICIYEALWFIEFPIGIIFRVVSFGLLVAWYMIPLLTED